MLGKRHCQSVHAISLYVSWGKLNGSCSKTWTMLLTRQQWINATLVCIRDREAVVRSLLHWDLETDDDDDGKIFKE